MKKIIIIGAGFGGLSAALRLSKEKGACQVTLIDKSDKFNFLPMLPDILGRNINPVNLVNDLLDFSKDLKFRLIIDRVNSVDLAKKQIFTTQQVLDYDYLIIASGSETNFYGNEQIRQSAFKLDEVQDGKIIREATATKNFDQFIIAGGGYTGIEVATNLKIYLDRNPQNKKVIIIERAPSILGPLPQWMKDYVNNNLKILGIEVLTASIIERIQEGNVILADGKVFNNAMLIWAAGVKTSDFIQKLQVQKNPQGRINVDAYLRLNDNCFVVGDSAYFGQNNNFLRMAVQFAIAQGDCAAKNIIRCIKGDSLIKFKPIDLGYFIPMANNNSCGQILGLNLKGKIPTLLHYMMCIYRSWGFKNKWGIFFDLINRR